jgi:SAM-dependent methyltransferase
MATIEKSKLDLEAFYADEARDRDSDAWIRSGGSARVPESAASHYFIDRKVNASLAMAALPADARVLEVGCSFGHMSFLLARRFREVVAVDLSRESIDLARRRAAHWGVANIRFEVGDAEDLADLPDQAFTGVFSYSTVRFCPHPERALAEFHRVLAPGGRAVVDVPNKRCPWYGPIKRAAGITPHIHDRLFEAEEIAALMRAAGFRAVDHRHILFTTKRTPAPVLPLARLADAVLERTPGVKGWSGIVMAVGRKDANG